MMARCDDAVLERVLDQVGAEFTRATDKFGSFHNFHEGYAVILEELDEAWREIKRRNYRPATLRKELIQVAAMAVRAIHDLIDTPPEDKCDSCMML